MKKKILIIVAIILVFVASVSLCACNDKASTVRHNIQLDADQFKVYRRMTFLNLRTDKVLYQAEGIFSVQTTYEKDAVGQQELGLLFKVGEDEYKMDYFSIAENVCYVIEQVENTHTNPYYWNIIWYVPLPNVEMG